MNSTTWVLLNTETNGLAAPIFVVEIGEERMRGWTPESPSLTAFVGTALFGRLITVFPGH